MDMNNEPIETAEVPATAEMPETPSITVEPLSEEFVDFDTFSKSDFRVVKVKECTAVPKSKKLLQFTLDDGTGKDRTILSGIHAYYEPEELVGKKVLVVANLKPRNLRGMESKGMLMFAENGDRCEIMTTVAEDGVTVD